MNYPFTVYPAIDLRSGQVVRLRHGDPDQQTTFSNDPVATGQRWLDAGARWLHVVNLDRAFDETGTGNWSLLPDLASLPLSIQFGGGIRTLQDVERALSAGVDRVILGTAAVEEPTVVHSAVRQFGPEKIAVSIDARDGFVKSRGWKANSAKTPETLGKQMAEAGIEIVIHTDISRDGVFAGANVQSCLALAKFSGLQVIVSGGVATLDDVRQALDSQNSGIAGIIIGRALYDGRVSLDQALALSSRREV
jgi:phosphoribosylformimino-5-aminoimidazole carboxamide ribotide isomerase